MGQCPFEGMQRHSALRFQGGLSEGFGVLQSFKQRLQQSDLGGSESVNLS